jgi:hypothetical protein
MVRLLCRVWNPVGEQRWIEEEGPVGEGVWEEGREDYIYLLILLSRYSTGGQAGDA